MQPTSTVWKILEFYGTRVQHRGKSRIHSFLRSALHATYDGDLEVKRRGLRWLLNPSDFVQMHLYWTGEYEPWDLHELSRWVSEGSVVLDIGANFGYYSLCLASAMNGKGRIYAFEPCETTFSRLQMNIALNQLEETIAAIPCGLSKELGHAYLDKTEGNSGAATLSNRINGEPVTLDTLDNFCQSHDLDRVDVIKIDVEGSELQVIEGGHATLTHYRPVLMVEFNPSALEKGGASIGRLSEAVCGLDYRLFIDRRGRLIPFQPDLQAAAVVNVFCLPGERVNDSRHPQLNLSKSSLKSHSVSAL